MSSPHSEKRISVGDRALVWGTVLCAVPLIVGAIFWLAHVDFTASSTAQAQEKMHAEFGTKLDDLIGHVSHLEGQVEEIKRAVKP